MAKPTIVEAAQTRVRNYFWASLIASLALNVGGIAGSILTVGCVWRRAIPTTSARPSHPRARAPRRAPP